MQGQGGGFQEDGSAPENVLVLGRLPPLQDSGTPLCFFHSKAYGAIMHRLSKQAGVGSYECGYPGLSEMQNLRSCPRPAELELALPQGPLGCPGTPCASLSPKLVAFPRTLLVLPVSAPTCACAEEPQDPQGYGPVVPMLPSLPRSLSFCPGLKGFLLFVWILPSYQIICSSFLPPDWLQAWKQEL